jgi:hypothetical protein
MHAVRSYQTSAKWLLSKALHFAPESLRIPPCTQLCAATPESRSTRHTHVGMCGGTHTHTHVTHDTDKLPGNQQPRRPQRCRFDTKRPTPTHIHVAIPGAFGTWRSPVGGAPFRRASAPESRDRSLARGALGAHAPSLGTRMGGARHKRLRRWACYRNDRSTQDEVPGQGASSVSHWPQPCPSLAATTAQGGAGSGGGREREISCARMQAAGRAWSDEIKQPQPPARKVVSSGS